MKTLEISIRIAHLEGKNWTQELYEFLREYRATPHTTTNVSACEALNKRKLKTTIPELPVTQYKQPKCMLQEPSTNIAQRDAMQKQKMKIYADLKAHVQEREIKPGEVVLMRQHKHNKLSTPYNPKPFVVEEKKGTMVTASNGSQTVTTNSSHLKVISKVSHPSLVSHPSDTKEESLPKRSKRHVKPPIRFSDYVQVIYGKKAEARNFSDTFIYLKKVEIYKTVVL